jgi:hypothetical protein
MTDAAPWTARGGHAAVTLPDASIVVTGGRAGSDNKNDVYRSRNGGTSWRLQTSNGGWTKRANHSAVSLPNGNIIIMGGFNDLTNPPQFYNDVWQSVDYGKTWTQVTANASWSPRCYHSSVVLPDGSIVIMGGRDNTWNLTNEVWRSTDGGTNWTQMTVHAGWTARALAGSAVLADGSIVVMGGVTGSGFDQYLNDVWRSIDSGATWTQLTEHAGWSQRIPYGAVTHPDGSLLLVGGNALTTSQDTWRLQTAGAAEQNPTYLYSQTGTYRVTLQAYNGYGVDSVQKQVVVIEPIPGDVDQSGTIDLADVVKALQVAAGTTGAAVSTGGDVNDDGKIGVAEAIADMATIAED